MVIPLSERDLLGFVYRKHKRKEIMTQEDGKKVEQSKRETQIRRRKRGREETREK